MADNPLSGGRNLALLSIAIAAAVHAEGLYKADSPVTSYVALSEVPSGAGSEQPFTLIEYYSAWCGHCQKFAPTYEAIALQARREFPELKVAAVNCPEHKDICTSHGISAYPTIVLCPGEKKFEGSHTKEAVFAWVQEQHRTSTGTAAAVPDAAATAATVAAAASQAVGRMVANDVMRQGDAAARAVGSMLQHAAHNASVVIQHPAADAAMLQLRPMPWPVPVDDVLAAARYTLEQEIFATLSAAPSHAYARTKLGALRAWLHLLHRALPHGRDGGAAATGASELLSGLHGRASLPSPEEWRALLTQSGVDAWPSSWHACNSSHAELHAYPCALWLLFHSLLAHASEPEALPSLHAVVGYIKEFFGCEDCRGHFMVLAAALEKDVREMASEHEHGRHRAALWLWQAHNHVNERLGAAELTDSAAAQFAEFAKVQWPSRSLCPECREVSRPQPGVKASVHWRRSLVLKVLYEHFCLEPRFECWNDLTRMGETRPQGGLSAELRPYGLAAGAIVLLLFAWMCGASLLRGSSAASVRGANHAPRKKRDHVV
jgi:thioredoxin-like negative regulator of GroEL